MVVRPARRPGQHGQPRPPDGGRLARNARSRRAAVLRLRRVRPHRHPRRGGRRPRPHHSPGHPCRLGITLVVYATVAFAALLAVGPRALARPPRRWPPRSAGTLDRLAPAVRVGGAVASLGVLLSLIAGVSRTAFAMAANGDLPRPLGAVHPAHAFPTAPFSPPAWSSAGRHRRRPPGGDRVQLLHRPHLLRHRQRRRLDPAPRLPDGAPRRVRRLHDGRRDTAPRQRPERLGGPVRRRGVLGGTNPPCHPLLTNATCRRPPMHGRRRPPTADNRRSRPTRNRWHADFDEEQRVQVSAAGTNSEQPAAARLRAGRPPYRRRAGAREATAAWRKVK